MPLAPVVIGAALLALLLAHAAHAFFGVGGAGLDSFFGQLVYGVLVVSAALGCLARAALVREERAGWALIGAGLLASAAAGQIYFSTSGAPAFSIGDGLNVTFHLATLAGLVLVARERLEHIERGLWLDAAIGALVAAALWAVLLEPLVHRTVVDGWSSAITIAYPLADLIVVVALIAVSAATGWRPGRSLALLTAGFALAAVADGAYAHQAAAGTYVDAGPLDSLFLAATLMIALAAWCRPRPPTAAVPGGRVFVFPAAFGLVALAIVVTHQLLHAGTLGFALATTALLAVIARVILPVAALAEETRKLRAIEARLSEANRRNHFGRWEWDPETDRTVASSEIYSILGLDPDQGLSLGTFIGMLDPEDGEAVEGLVTRALETGAPYAFEYPIHSDAVDRIVHVRGWRELGGNGRPLLVGTLQDVTERVRSAQALRESEERFSRSFEDAPTGMALTSVAPGEEGRLTRVNAAGCAMFGYSEEALLGKAPDDLSHPDDVAVGPRAWRRLMRGDDDVFCVEQRFRRLDGSTFWGVSHMSLVRDRTGEPLYGINQLEDNTARRKAELARERIIESALDAIISIDAAGIVTEFSPAAERLFGHSREEALGRDLAELVIPEALRERHRAGLAHAAAGEDTIIGQRLEVPAVRADGKELEIELSISRSDDDPLTFTAFVRDISARRAAERATRHAEERFRRGFEDSAVAMLIGSTGGKWERVNRAYCEMLGYTEEEMLRLGLEGITHPDELAIDLDVTPRLGRGEQYRHQREKRYIHADGHTVWGLVTITSIPGYEDQPGYIYSQVQDISARKRAEESLEAVLESVADGLCALDEEGRLTFMNPAAERLLGYREEELQGKDLRGAIHHRDPDGTPRPREAPSPLDGRGTGEIVRVEDDVFVCGDGSLLPVAYSVAPLTTETGRRGSVVAFRDITEHKAELVRREEEFEALRWVARIRRALNEEQFVLYAQPIVDLASDEVVQEELLIRMIGDEGEVIMPGKFLPAAEEYGLIEDIDIWVIGRAAELAADGRSVQINLSGRSIGSANVLRAIEHALKRTGAQPESLIFEITETTLNQDIEEAQVFAERLTQLGCGFALDDFGTGYGSFTYLRRLPIRYLKIDILFVRELLESEIDRHLVEAVVSLAHTLGQKTVAEGVEDEETLERLREIGVDYAQGYLLGRPAPCALAPTPALTDV